MDSSTGIPIDEPVASSSSCPTEPLLDGASDRGTGTPGGSPMQRQKSMEADQLRRRLRYFLMNPCEKFRAKGMCPWKLYIQIIKIALVTTQLVLFGLSRGAHIDFLETSEIAFKHLFLKDWTSAYETMPYPPSLGTFAIYTIPDFYSSVDFTLSQYLQTETLAIGAYDFTLANDTMRPVEFVKTHYQQGQIWAFNETYVFDSTVITDHFLMYPVVDANNVSKYDTQKYLASINESINFDRLIDVTLKFSVKTVHLKSLQHLDSPDCYQFDIQIKYDNSDHNGQMPVSLQSKEFVLKCHGQVIHETDDSVESGLLSFFDTIIIVVSVLSSALCARSLYRAYRLGRVTEAYFQANEPSKPLSFSDKMVFVNMWYLMIIFNDILTTVGCVFKILIENKYTSSYEACGVLLSTGNLLVWFGVLRYLSFFEKYNILLLTIKNAAPNVLRFLFCTGLIYLGFAICGWIVLGPYHIKFRYLSTASECLFSLINGDDIFTTFAGMQSTSLIIWWYSRLYLYIFISLFIYVVLSLFISVISDTYDTIKKYHIMGYPKSRLHVFASECDDVPLDRLFPTRGRTNGPIRFLRWISSLCCRDQ